MAQTFKHGDKVRLKSGGPDMIVEPSEPMPLVLCSWASGTKGQRKDRGFYPETLEPAEEPAPRFCNGHGHADKIKPGDVLWYIHPEVEAAVTAIVEVEDMCSCEWFSTGRYPKIQKGDLLTVGLFNVKKLGWP
jgi:uncharacterized protein YodC (DUF2158 family)